MVRGILVRCSQDTVAGWRFPNTALIFCFWDILLFMARKKERPPFWANYPRGVDYACPICLFVISNIYPAAETVVVSFTGISKIPSPSAKPCIYVIKVRLPLLLIPNPPMLGQWGIGWGRVGVGWVG